MAPAPDTAKPEEAEKAHLISLRNQVFLNVMLFLMALSSCLSISGIYLTLVIILAVFLLDAARKTLPHPPQRDFSIIGSIYAWRLWSLLLHRSYHLIGDIREVGEKVPYLMLSCYSLTRRNVLFFFHTYFFANAFVVTWFLYQYYIDREYTVFQRLFDGGRMVGFFGNVLHYAGYQEGKV